MQAPDQDVLENKSIHLSDPCDNMNMKRQFLQSGLIVLRWATLFGISCPNFEWSSILSSSTEIQCVILATKVKLL